MERISILFLALLFSNTCFASRSADAASRNTRKKPTPPNSPDSVVPGPARTTYYYSTETEGPSKPSSNMWTSSDTAGWTSSSGESSDYFNYNVIIDSENEANRKSLRGMPHRRSKSIQSVETISENSSSAKAYESEGYKKSEKSEIEKKLDSLSINNNANRPNSGRNKIPPIYPEPYVPIEEKYNPRRLPLFYGRSANNPKWNRSLNNEVEWIPPRNWDSDTSSSAATSTYPRSSPFSGASYTSVSSNDQPPRAKRNHKHPSSQKRNNIPRGDESKNRIAYSPKVFLPLYSRSINHAIPDSPESSGRSYSYPSSLTCSDERSDYSISSDDQQVQEKDAKLKDSNSRLYFE